MTLAVFVALYVLVYMECLVRRWLRASALLTWACLVTLGYVLAWNAWRRAACAWAQVTGWVGRSLHTLSFIPHTGCYRLGPGRAPD